MDVLRIVWQRAVNSASPDRADLNYLNLESAISKLEPMFLNFGIKIVLEKKDGNCKKGGIFIEGEPLEKILNLDKKHERYEEVHWFCKLCGKRDCERAFLGPQVYSEHLIMAAIFAKLREKFGIGGGYGGFGY